MDIPNVAAAICAIQGELAKSGISKDRKNKEQGYSFRGIDDVYGALAPLLAQHNLCIIPRYLSRDVVERQSKSERALFYTTVSVEFDLICAKDGSLIKAGPFYGEAMDTGDKSTNKAMSAAYKYMCLQVFCIPTEGDNDADTTTHEVRPNTARQTAVDAFEAMSAEEKAFLQEHAIVLIDMHEHGKDADMPAYVDSQRLQTEEKLALWSLLPSDLRSAYKKAQGATR